MEEALPEAPPTTATDEEGKYVRTYVLKMKAYLDQIECLGYPMHLVLGVNMILTLISMDYDQFVQNYNMHGIGKTIPELHAMLKLEEKDMLKKTHAVLATRQELKKNKASTSSTSESAVRINNMVPTNKVNKTTYEIWHAKLLNLSYLKVWGCEALVKQDTPNKLESRSIRPNGEALRKCILSGPYKPTTMLLHVVEATNDSLAVPEHTTIETPTNMSPENKAHFLAKKEVIHMILTGIRDDIYSTVDACQTAQEISSAPSQKPSIPSRSYTTTRHKDKEIAKPITPPSETASEEDSDPKQAQRDKDMQKNLALIAKTVNVAAARENVGSKVVQQSGIQCINCTEYGHFAKECRNPKRVKDSAYHKEKMLLYKQVEQADMDKEVDEQELEAHYSYMAKIQEVPTADSGTDSEPVEHVQNDAGYNVFANVLQHYEQSESDLKQQYLDEMKSLSNSEYHDEIKIAELTENFNGMSIEIRKKEKLLQLEQWANLSTHPSKRLNSFCYDDDDDEDYTLAVTPSFPSEEPDNFLSMGDEHLDTIPATKSDEVIKFSVENLIPIPSESEGIPEHKCDVPFHNNSPPLDVSKDQIEDFSDSNDESSSTDDDSFSIDKIDYVETSPPDSELVSSEVMEIVIPEVGGIDDDILLTIKDDVLREKLLNVNLLIAKIEALNANPTPSSDCMTHTTTHFDISLPEYEVFHYDHVKEISSGSPTTHSDSSLYASFIFDLLINPFPPADSSDFYEFADELIPFISPPEYDCFLFKVKPNSGDFTKDVVEDISPTKESKVHNALPTHPTLQLNLKFQPSSEYLFTYVVWIFLSFLIYSVAPHYLLSLRNEDTILIPAFAVKECDCLAQKLSKQTESVSKKVHTELLQRFAKVEKHSISLELALQKCKEQVKNDTDCNEKASNVFRKEHEQYFEIQDLKAQLQDKNIAISS
nr:zinc finger, CCHC-type [Tanacetum cinerariifolium]